MLYCYPHIQFLLNLLGDHTKLVENSIIKISELGGHEISGKCIG